MKNKKYRILYVEDDKIDRMAFERIAKKNDFPYDYTLVDSIQESKRILDSESFDVVLIDYQLRDGVAFELFDSLKDTPFIIITGTGDQAIAVKAMKAGAYDYIIKDPAGKHLLTLPITIKNSLKRKQTKDELKKYQEQLEELVKIRTGDLLKEKEFTDSAINTQIDTFFVFDPQTNEPIRWNKAFRDVTGYTDEEIAKMKVPYDWYNKDDLELAKKGTEKIFKYGQAVVEMDLITKDGKAIPFEYNASLIKDENGKPKYVISIGRDISERKKAQEKLHESGEITRALLSVPTDSIFLLDNNGIILDINDTAAKRLKKTQKELRGNNIYTLFPTKLAKSRKDKVDQVFRTGKLLRFEDQRDNTWFDNVLYPIFDSYGIVAKVAAIGRDITERKIAEQELKEKSRINQMLLDAFPCVAMLLKPSTREIVALNKAAIEAGAEIGKTCYGSWPKFEKACSFCKAPILWKTGKTQHLEIEAIDIYWDAYWLPIDEDLYMHYAFDITEKKKVDNAIKESEENFRTLVETAFDGITINDINGNYLYANKRAAEISGYSVVQLTKMNVKNLTLNEVYETIEQRIKKRIEEESSSGYYERSLVRKNGKKIPIELVAAKTIWQGEPVEMVFFRDISQRKKDEAELFKAKEKAEESDRLKSAFLANMSHEIRTPMNAIVGFANLLKDNSLEKDNANQFIDIINTKSFQLLELIDDIIDISRIEADEVKIENKECSLNSLIDELHSSFQTGLIRQGKSNIEFRTAKLLDDELCMILCDETRLRQVLSNFLSNAIKFTEIGFVEIGYAPLGKEKIKLWVKDSGIGIPKNKQKVIFDRFRQADEGLTRKYGGTGLGLAISKRLIELMGGEIGIESAKWKGSTFFFTIPYNRVNKTSKTKIKMVKEGTYNWKGKKILIVEDDIASSQLLKAILLKTQVNIILTETGEDAIDIFNSEKEIDLVLMDIQLPEIDGYEVTRRFKKLNPDVIIIAETAHAMKEDRAKSLKAGCDDYITKPIDLQELLRMMNKYLS